jgi:signal transduction histidine kinase/tetratricopeptide (TPR) repeat protein
MEFFAHADQLEKTEAALRVASDAVRLELLLSLAWQLRQRDTHRALVLADEVQALLVADAVAATLCRHQQQSTRLRLTLIRAEAHWLFGQFDASKALAEDALQGFRDLDDAIGCADAHWLLAWIVFDQGDLARTDVELAAMSEAGRADPVRALIGEAALARFALWRDVSATKLRWGARFSIPTKNLHPAAACWVEDFWGLAAALSSDYVQSIVYFSNVWELALASGQRRRAIFAAFNIGDSFKILSEYHASLEWAQRSLDYARESRWQNAIGIALTHVAESMSRLERYDTAHDMLREALLILTPKRASRDYAVTLQSLGDVELGRKDYASALDTFRLLEQRAIALDQPDLKCASLRGQAHALLKLDQAQQALQAAQAALLVEGAHADFLVPAMRVMADIHANHPLPPPSDMRAASTPLHYLQQALDLVAAVDDFVVHSALLDAMADEYAKVGDFPRAFHCAKQASLAREKTHNREAGNRANAMQVSHQTEQMRSDAEHHRQLAAAEARRAEVLQQTSDTLSNLGTIGQEITAHLDTEKVAQVLERHVHRLLRVDSIMVYRMDADNTALDLVFGVEDGERLAPYRIALSSPTSIAVRCVHDRREILVDYDPGQEHQTLIPGTQTTLSAMFAPLYLGDKAIGAISIQSRQRHAYDAREQLIIRTLCAYTAIALANAETLHALQQAQAQLVQQEKMASLGGLVAGFAHQLNTPIVAVKSSGQNITDALLRTLEELPQLVQTLDCETWRRFITLISQQPHQQHHEILNSREERALVRSLSEKLQAEGIDDAARKAAILVQLRTSELSEQALHLLRHAQSGRILSCANQLSIILNNAFNIDTATGRMAKIISALKIFSGIDQAQHKTESHLHQGIDMTLEQFHSQMQNKVELVRQYQTIAPLRCLPDQLDQVWSNLIHNALQAMAYQGRLSISIRADNEQVQVAISDTGPGVAEAIRERVFDAFFSTKSMGEGIGLGLAIVRKIIDRHGGSVTVQEAQGTEGAEGKTTGATFLVRLPYEPK